MKLPNLPADPHVTQSDGRATEGYALFFDGIIRALRNAVLGGKSLLTAGAIPKVESAGTLTESALKDNGTTVTLQRTISNAVQPTFVISDGVTLSKGRLGRSIAGERVDLTLNISYDGTNFLLDDVTKAGAYIVLLPATISFFFAAAAPNPAALVLAGQIIAGGFDAPTAYKVAGVQVVGAQMAAITAPSITTSTVSGTAGATYTGTEQTIINALKAAVNQLNTDVINLSTTVNSLRTVCSTHGLTL